MKLLTKVNAGWRVAGLFSQDQLAQTGCLQAVGRAVVVNLYRFLAPQQIGAVHADRACAVGLGT